MDEPTPSQRTLFLLIDGGKPGLSPVASPAAETPQQSPLPSLEPKPSRSRLVRLLKAGASEAVPKIAMPAFRFEPWGGGRVVGRLRGEPGNLIATGNYTVFWQRGKLAVQGPPRGTPHEQAIRDACTLWLDQHRETILDGIAVRAGAVYITATDGERTIQAKAFWPHLGIDVPVTVTIDGKTIEVSPVSAKLRGHREMWNHYRQWALAHRNRLMCRARALHVNQ